MTSFIFSYLRSNGEPLFGYCHVQTIFPTWVLLLSWWALGSIPSSCTLAGIQELDSRLIR